MGVMACDRKGCDQILCDHYSECYGYLCRECIEDLSGVPYIAIGSFMKTPPSKVGDKAHWRNYINTIFANERES